MMEELNPCPFCGNRAFGEYDSGKYWYECELCKSRTGDWFRDAEARAAWNTRHEPDDLIRTVKTRINELEEQIEENFTYRSRELVNHEIVVLKWVLSLRKQEETE